MNKDRPEIGRCCDRKRMSAGIIVFSLLWTSLSLTPYAQKTSAADTPQNQPQAQQQQPTAANPAATTSSKPTNTPASTTQSQPQPGTTNQTTPTSSKPTNTLAPATQSQPQPQQTAATNATNETSPQPTSNQPNSSLPTPQSDSSKEGTKEGTEYYDQITDKEKLPTDKIDDKVLSIVKTHLNGTSYLSKSSTKTNGMMDTQHLVDSTKGIYNIYRFTWKDGQVTWQKYDAQERKWGEPQNMDTFASEFAKGSPTNTDPLMQSPQTTQSMQPPQATQQLQSTQTTQTESSAPSERSKRSIHEPTNQLQSTQPGLGDMDENAGVEQIAAKIKELREQAGQPITIFDKEGNVVVKDIALLEAESFMQIKKIRDSLKLQTRFSSWVYSKYSLPKAMAMAKENRMDHNIAPTPYTDPRHLENIWYKEGGYSLKEGEVKAENPIKGWWTDELDAQGCPDPTKNCGGLHAAAIAEIQNVRTKNPYPVSEQHPYQAVAMAFTSDTTHVYAAHELFKAKDVPPGK